MKNFQAIISNLYNQDNFKNLYTIEIINKLIATLPYNLRKSFMYSSIKNEILLLAFDHPTSVSEFNNYKKIIMLNTLEQLKIINQDSVQFQKLHRIKDIKAYLPKNILNRFDIGDIDIEYNDDYVQLSGTFVSSSKIDYDDILKVEYCDDFDIGRKKNGINNAVVEAGRYYNDEFGNYHLYAYTHSSHYVIIYTENEIFVVSGENEKQTQNIYNQLSS